MVAMNLAYLILRKFRIMKDIYFPLANLWQIKILELFLNVESQNDLAEKENRYYFNPLSFRNEGLRSQGVVPCPKWGWKRRALGYQVPNAALMLYIPTMSSNMLDTDPGRMRKHGELEESKPSWRHAWLSSPQTKKNSKDVIEVGSKAAGAWSVQAVGEPEGKYH